MKCSNKNKKIVSSLIKCSAIVFLLLFFMVKPIIIREFQKSDNPIELSQENEGENEEGELEYEEDILEIYVFLSNLINPYFVYSDNKFSVANEKIESNFSPSINTPPPEFVA